jgi:hypothetical protein
MAMRWTTTQLAIQRMGKQRVATVALVATVILSNWMNSGVAQTTAAPASGHSSGAAPSRQESPGKHDVAAKGLPLAPLFVDVTRSAGIDFRLTCGSQEKRYIVETQCGGAAALDYDNDGWIDILFVDGSTIADYKAGKCHPPRLYHNNHTGTFTDVSITTDGRTFTSRDFMAPPFTTTITTAASPTLRRKRESQTPTAGARARLSATMTTTETSTCTWRITSMSI